MASPRVGMMKRYQVVVPLHVASIYWFNVARHFSIKTKKKLFKYLILFHLLTDDLNRLND